SHPDKPLATQPDKPAGTQPDKPSGDGGSKPAADGGTKPADAGTKPADAGTKPADAGTKPADAGTKPAVDNTPRELGRVTLLKGLPNLLLLKSAAKKEWQQAKPDAAVSTGDTLLALPGFRGAFRSSGVELTLWGNVPEFINSPLLESAIVVQNPSA